MKKLHLLLFVGTLFLFAGCKTTKKAEQTANTFLELLVKQKPKVAIKLVDTQQLLNVDYLKQVEFLANNDKDGRLKSYKKSMGFNTNITNGVAVVELNYTLIYERAEYHRQITLSDSRGNFLITSIQ